MFARSEWDSLALVMWRPSINAKVLCQSGIAVATAALKEKHSNFVKANPAAESGAAAAVQQLESTRTASPQQEHVVKLQLEIHCLMQAMWDHFHFDPKLDAFSADGSGAFVQIALGMGLPWVVAQWQQHTLQVCHACKCALAVTDNVVCQSFACQPTCAKFLTDRRIVQ